MKINKTIFIFVHFHNCLINYKAIYLCYRETRDSKACTCFVCLTGSNKGTKTNKGGRGIEKQNIQIRKGNGLNGFDQTNHLEKQIFENKTSALKLCSKCYQQIGRGISHECKTSKSSSNIKHHLNNVSKDQAFKLVSNVLKENKPITNKDKVLHLNTQGRKMRVAINPEKQRELNCSLSELSNLQSSLGNISNNNMQVVTNFIRCKAGKKSIPSNYKQELSKATSEFKHLYQHKTIEFDGYGGTKVSRPIVFTKASEIVHTVASERGCSNYIVKILADGGQKFLKFCISLISSEYIEDKENQTVDSKKARSTYRK